MMISWLVVGRLMDNESWGKAVGEGGEIGCWGDGDVARKGDAKGRRRGLLSVNRVSSSRKNKWRESKR
jgi:hypothetical protein